MTSRYFLSIALILALLSAGTPTQAAACAAASTSMNALIPSVQVFDEAQGKIVKQIPNNPAIQGEAKQWLASVTSLSPEVKFGDTKGYIFLIPLSPEVPFAFQEIQLNARQVYLFLSPEKPPRLLLLVNQKPYLLLFKHSVEPFLQLVGYPDLPYQGKNP